MRTCEDGGPNAMACSQMLDLLVSDTSNGIINVCCSLQMNATHVSSEVDSDNLVTVSCCHRVDVYM